METMHPSINQGYRIYVLASKVETISFSKEKYMEKEYTISACCGKRIDVLAEQFITVIDVDGGQVVDFFSECKENPQEFYQRV